MNPVCTMCRNGGSSYTVRARGKDKKVFSPAAVDLTTDLHSMGQFIQDGARIMFETVLNVEKSSCELILEEEESGSGRIKLSGRPNQLILLIRAQ